MPGLGCECYDPILGGDLSYSIILLVSAVLFPAIGVSSDSRPVSLPFKDMNGKKVRLSDLRGKTAVLNFWAT